MADLSPTERPDTARLRVLAKSLTRYEFSRHTAGQVAAAADEIDRLRRWKAEATIVLNDWEKVYVAFGSPGLPGDHKSVALLAEIERRLAAQSAPTTQPDADLHANLRRILADYDEARLLGPPYHTTRSNVIDAVRELLGDDT